MRERSRELLVTLVAATGVGCLLLYKLGSLTHGLAESEIAVTPFKTELHHLLNNPLNLPLSIVRLVIAATPYHGYTAARTPSAIMGLLTLLLFVYLVRAWYGKRTAWYGAILLAVAPWYLHASRLATNDVLYPLGLLALLAYCTKLQKPHSATFVLLTPILLSLLLYIPGFIWIVAICMLWYGPDFRAAWGEVSGKVRILCLLLWPLMLSLLAYGFYRTPHLVVNWLGAPDSLPAPLSILREFGAVWLHIFIRGPQSLLLGLGYLPLLNVFASAMFVVGAYFYIKHWRAPRSRLLATLAIIGGMLSALQGPVSVLLVLPLVYILVAGGLGYLLNEWLKTFPRNPFARTLGYGLVTLAVMVSSLYNLRQYFIAWPHNSTTHTTFRRQI